MNRFPDSSHNPDRAVHTGRQAMTEDTTPKEQQEDDGSPKQSSVLRVIAIFFLILSLLVAIVIMLRPLPVFPPNVFPGNAEMALWLLFTLSLAFGIVLNALGATKENRWRFSDVGGTIYVILGFVSAVEILLLRTRRNAERKLALVSVRGPYYFGCDRCVFASKS
jgi:hypothetical protein